MLATAHVESSIDISSGPVSTERQRPAPESLSQEANPARGVSFLSVFAPRRTMVDFLLRGAGTLEDPRTAAELSRDLGDAVRRLWLHSPDQARVFELYFYASFPVAQIAIATAMTLADVEAALAKARDAVTAGIRPAAV